MKNCTNCKHAEWQRTAAGKLHPSGDGKCTFEYKLPPLPACMWWPAIALPKPSGWLINRRKDMSDHCPHFARP